MVSSCGLASAHRDVHMQPAIQNRLAYHLSSQHRKSFPLSEEEKKCELYKPADEVNAPDMTWHQGSSDLAMSMTCEEHIGQEDVTLVGPL